MKFAHLNIRGHLNNFTSLHEFLTSHATIDILSLSETHIINHEFNDNDSLYNIPGYKFLKRNRKVGKGGSVAVYLKENTNFNRREDLEHLEIECLLIEIFIKKSKSLLVGCFLPSTREFSIFKI